jgi:methylated-DNA-[protein]-cysteine S-methyltransferase
MSAPGYVLFDTALGRCGLAWTERGIAAVALPEASAAALRRQLLRRCLGATERPPPPVAAEAVAGIVALLQGTPADLAALPLDQAGVPPFHREVYAIARTIPVGATLTYGDIAQRLALPGAARAVGQALGQNPWPIIVPCHRVLAANGRLGGFSAHGGLATKRRLLAIEGADAVGGLPLFAPR